MKIPFVDLKSQYNSLKSEIDTEIHRVLSNSNFILGDQVQSFENDFATFSNAQHAISCSSGTSGLILALRALGIGVGDEVISVSNTWVSTIFAISLVGAKPVFVDIDPRTYLISTTDIESKIGKKTKAIIPVHLYGQLANMKAIQTIAKKYNLKIIEDACQAHGAMGDNFGIGQHSDIAVYSFYPGKNLGAYGDGGILTTNNKELAESLQQHRNMGQSKKHIHQIIGDNSRLDTLQACVLQVKLKHLSKWNQLRQEKARYYDQLLQEKSCIIPFAKQNFKHVYHLYVIQVENRDKVLSLLHENGIMAQIHYPTPIHLQPCYHSLKIPKGSLPITEEVSQKIISLPLFPEITSEEQEYVTNFL